MSITSITLPSGVVVETSAPIAELAILLQSTPPKAAPTVRPEVVVPKVAATSTKSTAKPSTDGKALLRSIRELEAHNTHESLSAAIGFADEAGWSTVAAKLREKLAKVSPPKAKKATQTSRKASTTKRAAKPQVSSEKAEKVGGEAPTVVVRTAKQVAAEAKPTSTIVRPVDEAKLRTQFERAVLQGIEEKRLHEVVTNLECMAQEAAKVAFGAKGVQQANACIVKNLATEVANEAKELLATA